MQPFSDSAVKLLALAFKSFIAGTLKASPPRPSPNHAVRLKSSPLRGCAWQRNALERALPQGKAKALGQAAPGWLGHRPLKRRCGFDKGKESSPRRGGIQVFG